MGADAAHDASPFALRAAKRDEVRDGRYARSAQRLALSIDARRGWCVEALCGRSLARWRLHVWGNGYIALCL